MRGKRGNCPAAALLPGSWPIAQRLRPSYVEMQEKAWVHSQPIRTDASLENATPRRISSTLRLSAAVVHLHRAQSVCLDVARILVELAGRQNPCLRGGLFCLVLPLKQLERGSFKARRRASIDCADPTTSGLAPARERTTPPAPNGYASPSPSLPPTRPHRSPMPSLTSDRLLPIPPACRDGVEAIAICYFPADVVGTAGKDSR